MYIETDSGDSLKNNVETAIGPKDGSRGHGVERTFEEWLHLLASVRSENVPERNVGIPYPSSAAERRVKHKATL